MLKVFNFLHGRDDSYHQVIWYYGILSGAILNSNMSGFTKKSPLCYVGI